MQISPPQSIKPDIFSFGFDKSLNRPILATPSSLVYNQIDERLSILIPANNAIAGSIPGLKEVQIVDK